MSRPTLGLITCATTIEFDAISTLVPSGSAPATCLPAMMPLAPPRFSTTTVWPSSALILSANSRATASTPPPGGKLTTRRTGREGLSCAVAGPGASRTRLQRMPTAFAIRRIDAPSR